MPSTRERTNRTSETCATLIALPISEWMRDTASTVAQLRLLPLCQNDMRGARRRDVLAALIAELGSVDAGEKVFAGAEQDGGNRQVHLVDQSGAKILLDRGDPAAEPDVLTFGRSDGALKGSVDAV